MIIMEGNLLKTPFQIIAHQTNCLGIMGGGVALAIKNTYPNVYEEYKSFCDIHGIEECFGSSCVVGEKEKIIINAFGQKYIGSNECMTDYAALKSGLSEGIKTIRLCWNLDSITQLTIAIPYKIGCGLAGGDWEEVSKLLEEIEVEQNVVFIAYNIGK